MWNHEWAPNAAVSTDGWRPVTGSPSPVDASPTGPSVAPAPASWRSVGGAREASPSAAGRRPTDALLFEVTDASIVRDGASKYVVSWSRQESTPKSSRGAPNDF